MLDTSSASGGPARVAEGPAASARRRVTVSHASARPFTFRALTWRRNMFRVVRARVTPLRGACTCARPSSKGSERGWGVWCVCFVRLSPLGPQHDSTRQRKAGKPLRSADHVLRQAVQGCMDEGPPRWRLSQGARRSARAARQWRLFARSAPRCVAQAGDTREGYDALTQRPDKSLIQLEPGACIKAGDRAGAAR